MKRILSGLLAAVMLLGEAAGIYTFGSPGIVTHASVMSPSLHTSGGESQAFTPTIPLRSSAVIGKTLRLPGASPFRRQRDPKGITH